MTDAATKWMRGMTDEFNAEQARLKRQKRRRRLWFSLIFGAVMLDVLIVVAFGELVAQSPILRAACSSVMNDGQAAVPKDTDRRLMRWEGR